jgi:hypothetical protein
MDERRVRPRRLRRGRRLTEGTVVVTSHDDDGRVNHAIRYDESMEHVLEELEGDAAEAAYGSRGRVVIAPARGTRCRLSRKADGGAEPRLATRLRHFSF